IRDRMDCPVKPGNDGVWGAVWARLFLAHRTKKRRTPGLHDAPHGALAARRYARLALAVVDAEVVLEQPKLAVGAGVVAQRGAAGLDRVIEHRLDARDQPLGALVRCAGARGDGRGLPPGREPRAVQRLADIDVAQARHHALAGE